MADSTSRKLQDPASSFRFVVKIGGFNNLVFTECSGLDFETKTFDYEEGGLNSHVHRLPTGFVQSNLTFKKGISENSKDLWNWVLATLNGQYKLLAVTVEIRDFEGKKPIRSWNFVDAYPIKWSATPFNAEQSTIAIETLVLAHQGMAPAT